MLSTPPHSCQPIIPDDVNVIARRAPIPLFGAGLVEAIPDETLLALADPEDRNRDGVSGRAAVVVDVATGRRRVGRFGWKAQHATLLAFGADAYRNEMGITNDLFPNESAFGISASPDAVDAIRFQTRRIDRTRPRGGGDRQFRVVHEISRAHRSSARRCDDAGGRAHVLGHRMRDTVTSPRLTTGASANPLFDRRPVPLFSDLLLHDIGTGDGIRQAAAEPSEIRTPALWGLRVRRPLLHDGSAATIADAVMRHGGEAETARRGYDRLTTEEREQLLAFLRSL